MAKKQSGVDASAQEFSVTVMNDKVVINGRLEFKDPVFIQAFQQEKAKGVEPRKFFFDALRLGVYGKLEARIAAFLKTAENDLNTGLENLKYILTAQEFIENSAAKGAIAERKIEDVLIELIKRRSWEDTTKNTGSNDGVIPDCKIGDITSDIGGSSSRRVVIEAKMNAQTILGDPTMLNELKGKDHEKKAIDTAYGQLTYALANRNAHFAMIVFDRDKCSPTIKNLEPITIFPEIPGMVVKIGPKSDDFSALELAYGISRDLAKAYERGIDENRLILVTKRMVRDANNLNKFSKQLEKVEKGAQASLDAVKELRNFIVEVEESMSRTKDYLEQILNGSPPSDTEMTLFFAEAARKES